MSTVREVKKSEEPSSIPDVSVGSTGNGDLLLYIPALEGHCTVIQMIDEQALSLCAALFNELAPDMSDWDNAVAEDFERRRR